MDLAEEIKAYYYQNFRKLPKPKQFHFASRMAAWYGDQVFLDLLAEMRDYMLPDAPELVLNRVLNSPKRELFANDLRAEYFAKYPNLFGLHEAFFRIRHLKEVYGIDLRQELTKVTSPLEIEQIYTSIKNDYPALRVLGRFAVDYIYLFEQLYGTNEPFDPNIVLAHKSQFSLRSRIDAHLFIYLYTHCIIADSNFYIRNIPAERLPVYKQMVNDLTALLKSRDDIKFDTKFEYLVACRLIGEESVLSEKIVRQASDSLSEDGTFIVDKLIKANRLKLNSFSGSEHRNTLFVMSAQAYRPHKILVEK